MHRVEHTQTLQTEAEFQAFALDMFRRVKGASVSGVKLPNGTVEATYAWWEYGEE